MIYVGQPYSGSPELMEVRYQIGMAYSCHLMNSGDVGVYSPITHCHVMAHTYDMPKDAEFWRRENFYMLSLSRSMNVLQLEGHKKSEGLQAEIRYCNNNGIQVVHVPETYIKNNVKGAEPWLQKARELVTD